jgi:hypothetical protein
MSPSNDWRAIHEIEARCAISALVAMPILVHAQQGGPRPNVPKPTKADVQKVVQIITNDKAKPQAYCDLNKLLAQMDAAGQKNDTKTVQALGKQSGSASRARRSAISLAIRPGRSAPLWIKLREARPRTIATILGDRPYR